MRNIFLILLVFQSLSYSQDISLDDLLNIQSATELKVVAFENSFVPSYSAGATDYLLFTYGEDFQTNLSLQELQWVTFDGKRTTYLTVELSLDYEKYVNENSILRERLLKSIKNKCDIETIYYWKEEIEKIWSWGEYKIVRRGGRTNVLEESTGEIGMIEYNCENKFKQKVSVSVNVPDKAAASYSNVPVYANFTILYKEAEGLLSKTNKL